MYVLEGASSNIPRVTVFANGDVVGSYMPLLYWEEYVAMWINVAKLVMCNYAWHMSQHVPNIYIYIQSKINWPVIVVLHTWRLHVSVKYPYIYQQDQVIMEIHMKRIFGFWYFLVQTWDINNMPTPTTARWNHGTKPGSLLFLSFTKWNSSRCTNLVSRLRRTEGQRRESEVFSTQDRVG